MRSGGTSRYCERSVHRPRQLRAIVHWQATLVALAILVIGVPVGIVLGRWIVQQLTGTLGIVPGVDLPRSCSSSSWSRRSWRRTCWR